MCSGWRSAAASRWRAPAAWRARGSAPRGRAAAPVLPAGHATAIAAAGSTTALIAETKGVDRDAESGAGAAGATSAASNGSESGGSEVIELSPSGSQRRRGGYSKGRQYDNEADVLMVEREGRPGGGAAISTGVRNALHGAGI